MHLEPAEPYWADYFVPEKTRLMKSELSGDFVISGVTSCCGCCGSACKARSWIFRRSLIALLARA